MKDNIGPGGMPPGYATAAEAEAAGKNRGPTMWRVDEARWSPPKPTIADGTYEYVGPFKDYGPLGEFMDLADVPYVAKRLTEIDEGIDDAEGS